MSNIRSKIGFEAERLKHLRELRQLSQREFARQCGFSETLIRKYEFGESDPAGHFLKIISEQLDVSADYLLGLSNEPRGHLGDGTLNENEKTVIDVLRREGWIGVARLAVERVNPPRES